MSVLSKVQSQLDFVRGVIEGQRKGSVEDTLPLLAEEYAKGTTTASEEYDSATKDVTKQAEYVSRGGNTLIWGAYAMHVLDCSVEDAMLYATTLITRKKGEGPLYFKHIVDTEGVDGLAARVLDREDAAAYRKQIQELVNNSTPVKLGKAQSVVAGIGDIVPNSRDAKVAQDIIKQLADKMGVVISFDDTLLV